MDSRMPVKEEAEMDRDDGERSFRQRISRLKEGGACESGYVQQGCRRKSHRSKKRSAKGHDMQEPLCNSRLVKIELDAAEVLADFSRLVHRPSLKGPGDLKWSAKRKRTTRSYEASDLEMKPEDTHITVKKCIPSYESQRSDLDNTPLSHGDKASSFLDCRAESPSSPLPPSRLTCRAFLVASKSAFQRVVPTEAIQKPAGLISIKAEMEELQLDGLFSRPPVSQKLRTLKSPEALCPAKAEPLDERDPLVEFSDKAGLVVVNKPKTTLSEEDKEARRLRRIQANRESARQTIRRKQILCEELTRQAASLALENEGMKQKREMLMQEFYFLKGQNYHLKTQLEMGSSGNLGPGTVQQMHRMPSQLESLPIWQGTSLPCTGFPSHLFGWPSMMVPAQAVNCPEWLNKKESLEEYSRKLADYQSMEFESTLVVPGIPVSSPVSVTKVSAQKCGHHLNDLSSLLPTCLPCEEGSSPGAAGIETLNSTGASCNVDLAASVAQQGLEKEVGINSQTTLANENAMQARGSLCQPTAVVLFRGACELGDNYSTSRVAENMEHSTGLQIALPVTCGSSCAGSLGRNPLNGPGAGGLYGWRVTYAAAAAAARKRRGELTRRKRCFSKASKLTRQRRQEKGEENSLEGKASPTV